MRILIEKIGGELLRGFIKKITAAALSCALTLGLCGVASAVENSTESFSGQTELYVRASQIKDLGTYVAIQAALDTARFGASESNVYRVTVEPGSYDLTRALHIYSNTVLQLEGVTLNRNPEATANMLRTGEYDSETEGATGYDAHSNITVEGGVFDGGGTCNTMIKVAHAKNFVMKNITFQNEQNGHIMEIAGVDGFTVKGCEFKDHRMDPDEVGYEAIQLDILKSGHIVQCRSEALTMKNILIEDCLFEDCPRGVGTHTAILNAPFDGVKIRNNTFRNMGSAAIQGMNWKNCEISGNVIDGTPRGISIYSMFDGGQGTYPAGVLAREGNTSTDISESYIRPTDSNIIIADNTITNCGTVKDIYAPYESAAISMIGKVINKNYSVFEDGSGALPKGDYYITGVKIFGNDIETNGYGIRLSDISSVTMGSNRIRCAANEFDKVKYHGISLGEDTIVKSISGCDIEGSVNSGIQASDSYVYNISDCRVVDCGADAIQFSDSSRGIDIVDNYISGSKDCGVAAMDKSKIDNVSGNTIRDCKYKTVYAAKTATAKTGKNSSEASELEAISLNWDTVTMGLGESYVFTITSTPAAAKTSYIWSSADTSVARVEYDGRIRAVGQGSTEVTVTAGNGLKATCKVNVCNAPESIALNKNMLVLGEGEQFDLNSTIPEGSAAQKIYYYSNNEGSVAVQKIGGLVTAKSIGTATVVAKTYNEKPASCNVIVKKAPNSIKLDKTILSLGTGESYSIHASIPEGTASAITFTSSDPGAVRVDEHGNLYAVALGTSLITASTFNGYSETCAVTVSESPASISFAENTATVGVGESVQITAQLSNGMSNLTYKSSDPNVCKVDSTTGMLTGKSTGGAVITATSHNGRTAYLDVTVN